jgi:histidine ammonia-lyase
MSEPDVSAVTLDAAPFTIDDLDALASGPSALTLSDAARGRVTSSRAVVERYAAGDEPVYGLTTGLGGNLGFRIAPSEVAAFQKQIVVGRTLGAGEPFPEPVCRAALIARCISLAKGGAGISPPVLDLMLAMVERGVTPVIPRRGSIGDGDLGLAAHIGAVVIGRGEAWHAGKRLAGSAALAAAGLAPVELGGRDGLALCNTSAVTAGHAALVLAEAGRLLLFAVHAAALAAEGYAANPLSFGARIAALRPAARQEEAAALFRLLLEGSYLNDAGAAREIQDPLSFRCLSQIVGVVLQAHADARREVEVELNAVAESPVVLLPDGPLLSTANFHTSAIALTFDSLAIAFTHMATACFQRIGKLLTPAVSGLPRYLSPVGRSSAGYVPVQKLGAALLGEIRLRATPASLDAMPVSDTVEDVAPQTPLAIAKLADQIVPLRIMAAVEALIAAQAVDLRREARLAPRTRRLYDAVRAVVPRLEADREPAPDIERVSALAADPDLLSELAARLDGLELPFLPRFSALSNT